MCKEGQAPKLETSFLFYPHVSWPRLKADSMVPNTREHPDVISSIPHGIPLPDSIPASLIVTTAMACPAAEPMATQLKLILPSRDPRRDSTRLL